MLNPSGIELFGLSGSIIESINFRDLYEDKATGRKFSAEMSKKGFVRDFGVQVVLEDRVATALTQNLALDLGHIGHAAGQQILAAGPGQFGAVVFGVHARVGDKHRTAQAPAAQIRAHHLNCTDIGGVAGQNPASYRDALTGDCQRNDHLRGPEALLAVPKHPDCHLFV